VAPQFLDGLYLSVRRQYRGIGATERVPNYLRGYLPSLSAGLMYAWNNENAQ
jgi:hypothetical protein